MLRTLDGMAELIVAIAFACLHFSAEPDGMAEAENHMTPKWQE